MVWPGYVDFANINIINNAATIAAASAHGIDVQCAPCPDLHRAVGDPPYSGNIRLDDAPWYDRTRPESTRFLGLIGLGLDGISSDPVERAPTELITAGSAIGPLRRTGREIVVTAAVIALDEAGLAYAYEYLSSVLKGGMCADSVCTGDTLCWFAACPEPTTKGYGQLRHLYQVGLLDGLEETARNFAPGAGNCDSAQGCCDGLDMQPIIAQITFSLVAGTPYIYREPITIGTGGYTDLTTGELLPKYDPEAEAADCDDVVSCLTDPNCKQPPLPPAVAIPTNPCWPTGAYDARRSWITVDPRIMPQWGETVPVIEVDTGAKAIRRMIIRFYSNPAALDCSVAGADPCSACADVSITYLPAGAILTIDGRTQTASVDCSGGQGLSTAQPVLYGRAGSQFIWPTFECPTGFCIEILAQADTIGDGAQVRVALVPRGDAG